jgi:hypothetical protein
MIMNEAEKKLVGELRSGRYRQTIGRLREIHPMVEGYCCLGVACDISGLGEWEGGEFKVFDESNFSEVLLPYSVLKWLGWKTARGLLNVRGQGNRELSLIELNDEGLSFDQIADVIEAGLVVKEGE